MPDAVQSQPWLQSPLRTAAGDLELAGWLENIEGIDPGSMRILGSYALVLMVAGHGYYRDARGTDLVLDPGDAVLVFPDLAHAYGPRSGGNWTQIYFVFSGPQFDLWRRRALLRPDRPVWRLGAAEHWRQRLSAVLERNSSATAGGALRAFGRFLEVLTDMIAADTERATATEHDTWLEKSLRLLGHRSAQAWLTPQEVAREVGLSYETFRKRFVERTAESPGQFQKRRRIEWACAAIYHGQHTMKEIADELGFCDVFHFSKAFKQGVGMTPSEYRRRAAGG